MNPDYGTRIALRQFARLCRSAAHGCAETPPPWRKVIASRWNGQQRKRTERKSDRLHISSQANGGKKRGSRNSESRAKGTPEDAAHGNAACGSVTLAEIRYAGVGRTSRSGCP